jgi:hypothetical protein
MSDRGAGGNGRVRDHPGISTVLSDEAVGLNLPVRPFLIEDSLEFDEAGGKEQGVIGWKLAHGILKIERIGAPENEVLEQLFPLKLFKEQFNKRFGKIADHIKFGPAADSSSQEELLTDFGFDNIDQRRKGRVVSKLTNLPDLRTPDGIAAERVSYVFEKNSFCHSNTPSDVKKSAPPLKGARSRFYRDIHSVLYFGMIPLGTLSV